MHLSISSEVIAVLGIISSFVIIKKTGINLGKYQGRKYSFNIFSIRFFYDESKSPKVYKLVFKFIFLQGQFYIIKKIK
jgi:hypothetical protein